MKSFVIINGTSVFFINAENMEIAKDHAIAACNHSLEIIVREVCKTDEMVKRLKSFVSE